MLGAFAIPANVHNTLAVQVVESLTAAVPLTDAGTEEGLLAYVVRGEAPIPCLGFSVGTAIAITVITVILGQFAIAILLRTLRWRRIAMAAGRVGSGSDLRRSHTRFRR